MRATVVYPLGALFSAAVTIASPLGALHHALHRRKYVTNVVTHWTTVTITDGVSVPEPTSTEIENLVYSTVYVKHTHTQVWGENTQAASIAAVSSEAPTPSSTSTASSSTSSVVVVLPLPETTTSIPPVITFVPPTTSSDPPSTIVVVPSTTSAAIPTASSGSGSGDSSMPSVALNLHNKLRARNQAAALTWSEELAGYAAQGSNCSIWGHNMVVGSADYGQNVAMNGSSNANAFTEATAMQAAIESWYSEEKFWSDAGLYKNYDAGVGSAGIPAGEQVGHFTQMVWLATTEVGCSALACTPDTALGEGSMTTWNTVCNYRTRGNVAGQYATNVLPLVS